MVTIQRSESTLYSNPPFQNRGGGGEVAARDNSCARTPQSHRGNDVIVKIEGK